MFSFTQLIKIFLFHLKIMFLNLDVFSRCTVHMQSLSLHMHIKYTASLLATHLQLYDFYYLALCIYIYMAFLVMSLAYYLSTNAFKFQCHQSFFLTCLQSFYLV